MRRGKEETWQGWREAVMPAIGANAIITSMVAGVRPLFKSRSSVEEG